MKSIDALAPRGRRRPIVRLCSALERLEDRRLLSLGISPAGEPQLSGAPGAPLNNVEVASFTITDASGSPGTKWNCRITWGDGSQDKRVPATDLQNGSFGFFGTHTYSAAGTYTITVNIAVPGSHTSQDNVVTTSAVIARSLKSISVTPANPKMPLGASQQFSATGIFSDNTTENLNGKVTWSSSNNGVATITSGGLANSKAQGATTISARFNGVTGSTLLTVNPPAPPLHVVSVTPSGGKFQTLPNGKIVVTFNEQLGGLTPDAPNGGGFAAFPFAVKLVPQGPSGTFNAPAGTSSGHTKIPATLVYHVNANNTSTITLFPRAPLGTDNYRIAVSGSLKNRSGATLTDSQGNHGAQFTTFTIKTTAPNATPLKVVGVTTRHASVPINNGATIAQPDTIAIGFNKQVDFLTLNTDTVQLLAGPSNTPVTAAVAYSPTTKTVFLTPEGPLVPGTTYTISVAASVTDDQGFPAPDAAFTLGSPFTRTFQVSSAGVGAGHGPLVALSTNGHLGANPGFGPARKTPFGYATIPFSETIDLSSLGPSSVMLVTQLGGLNNNGLDKADTPLNAQFAFNPNTNELIIVPTVVTGNDIYRYFLSGIKATNGDPLTNPGGKLPVTDGFAISVPAPSVRTAAHLAITHATGAASVAPDHRVGGHALFLRRSRLAGHRF